LFIRIALREYDPMLFSSFLGFYAILGVLAAYFTYIYFNYFEFDLANLIFERYQSTRSN